MTRGIQRRGRQPYNNCSVEGLSHAPDVGDKSWHEYIAALDLCLGQIDLPIVPALAEIRATVSANPVTILESPTGSGKSTIVPLAILGQFNRIYQTQPSVAAARNVYERMAQILGEDGQHLVGYQTSNEGIVDPENRVIVCTSGLLLMQMMQEGKIVSGDGVMLDECHQGDTPTDVVLAMCHERGITVILSSATIDTHELAVYSSRARGGIPVPIISLEGKPRNVIEGDGGLVSDEIIDAARRGKNPLVFLPTLKSIEDIEDIIAGRLPGGYTVLRLHADQTPDEQQRCIEVYEGGLIVLATNVGQTSLTYPGVDMVINPGLERTGDFVDGVKDLPLQPCSVFDNTQRRGRIDRLDHEASDEYVRAQLDGYARVDWEAIPERSRRAIEREDLSGTEIRLALGGLALRSLDLISNPGPNEIDATYRRLARIGAATLDLVSITPVGQEMARLPIEHHYARMIVESRQYPQQVRLQMIAAAAARQTKGIGDTRAQGNHKWQELSHDNTSEFIQQLEIFVRARGMSEKERAGQGIIEQRYRKAMIVYERLANDAHIDPDMLMIPSQTECEALLACVISGSSELFVRVKEGLYRDRRGEIRKIHPSSNVQSYGLIMGNPLDIGRMNTSGTSTLRVITDVTGVDLGQLARYGSHRCTYEPIGMRVMGDEGHVVARSHVLFDGSPTRSTLEKPAVASQEVHRYVVDVVSRGDYGKDHSASSHVGQVYASLHELYALQHRTTVDLNIHERVSGLVSRKIPQSIVSVDEAIEYIAPEDIKNIISSEDRENILMLAPDRRELFYEDAAGQRYSYWADVTYFNHEVYLVISAEETNSLPDVLRTGQGQEVVVRVTQSVSGSRSVKPQKRVAGDRGERARRRRRQGPSKAA